MVCGLSDAGKVRENNEDRFWINEAGNLFVVADGLGGHQAGEVASEKVIELLKSMFSDESLNNFARNHTPAETFLKQGLVSINEKIYSLGKEFPQYSGMGSTAAIVYLEHSIVNACHVGDSRIL